MSDDVVHRLSVEGVDPLALAGVNDANLLELARRLGVRVSLRGDNLSLAGSAEAIERAGPVAQALIDLARMGENLDVHDVERLISDEAHEDMMPRERVQKALETRTIEIAPLAYMRGRTLSDAFVILDEAQNATGMQMKMFLTRLGVNSRAVITGDKTQIDLPNREDSGLLQVERILPGIEGIGFCYLGDADVVRHRLVRDIIRAYAEDAQG